MRLHPIVIRTHGIIHRDGGKYAYTKWKELSKSYTSVFTYGKSTLHPMNCYKAMVF